MKKLGATVLAAVLVSMSLAGCAAPPEEKAPETTQTEQKQPEKISHFTNTRKNDIVISYDDGLKEWDKADCEHGCCAMELKHNSGNGIIYTDVYELKGQVNSADDLAKLLIPEIKADYNAKEVSEPQHISWGIHEGQMVDVVTNDDVSMSIFYTFNSGYGVATGVEAKGDGKDELIKQFKERFLDENFRIYIR